MTDDGVRLDIVPPDYASGAPLPWWAKLASKLAIAALRLPRAPLRRAGVNRHSFVAEAESRVLGEPMAHVARFTALHGRAPRGVLEVGPGAGALTALMAARGASVEAAVRFSLRGASSPIQGNWCLSAMK